MNKEPINYPALTNNKYLIDTHCHLDMELYNLDLDKVIKHASKHGVKKIITIGVDISSSLRAIEIAKKYQDVHATIGVHPHDVKNLRENDYEELQKLCDTNTDHIVGYGEIGLDYVKSHSEPASQRFHFNKQLDLAFKMQLPIIVHNREAETDTLKILQSKKSLPYSGVMHCFSGNYDFAKKIIDLGMFISIPGIITFKNASTLHEVVKKIPIEHIIIETDGPFLSPHPYRGRRNEPVNVLYVAAKVAELKNMDITEVANITSHNAQKLFNLN